jgi:ATP:corrinoid adenosyltransferase
MLYEAYTDGDKAAIWPATAASLWYMFAHLRDALDRHGRAKGTASQLIDTEAFLATLLDKVLLTEQYDFLHRDEVQQYFKWRPDDTQTIEGSQLPPAPRP